MAAPKIPAVNSPVVQRAITTLQLLYGVLPAEIRLVMADAVAKWADTARRQALSQLGVPESPPNEPPTYTTTGHRAG